MKALVHGVTQEANRHHCEDGAPSPSPSLHEVRLNRISALLIRTRGRGGGSVTIGARRRPPRLRLFRPSLNVIHHKKRDIRSVLPHIISKTAEKAGDARNGHQSLPFAGGTE